MGSIWEAEVKSLAEVLWCVRVLPSHRLQHLPPVFSRYSLKKSLQRFHICLSAVTGYLHRQYFPSFG